MGCPLSSCVSGFPTFIPIGLLGFFPSMFRGLGLNAGGWLLSETYMGVGSVFMSLLAAAFSGDLSFGSDDLLRAMSDRPFGMY